MSIILIPQLEEYVLRHIKKTPDHLIMGGLTMLLTMTLKPKHYNYTSITQYELSINVVKALLGRYTKGFILATELTQAGNVHYHALCMFDSDFRRISLINAIKKNHLLGFFKLSNPVANMGDIYNCLNYMIKSVALTERILHTPQYKPEVIYCDKQGLYY